MSDAEETEVLPEVVSVIRDSLPLEQDDVYVHFDPARFARKSNEAQEQAIASVWRRKCHANGRLYNGSKFRYAGLAAGSVGSAAVTLKLGLTCYRDLLGTNYSGGRRLLQEAGAAVHEDRQAFLADPLGTGALLLTGDNRLVFVRRAGWTGEYPGRVDRPGGHAEPGDVLRLLQASDPERWRRGEEAGPEDLHRDLTELPPEAVLEEVFQSGRKEIRDELGIPLTHLSRAYLLGFQRDRNAAGRPTAEFIVRCSLPSAEVERIYNEKKHPEADESRGIIFFTRDELLSDNPVFPIPDLCEVQGPDSVVLTQRADEVLQPASDQMQTECQQDPVKAIPGSPTPDVSENCPPDVVVVETAQELTEESEVRPVGAKIREQGGKKRRRNRKNRNRRSASKEADEEATEVEEKPPPKAVTVDNIPPARDEIDTNVLQQNHVGPPSGRGRLDQSNVTPTEDTAKADDATGAQTNGIASASEKIVLVQEDQMLEVTVTPAVTDLDPGHVTQVSGSPKPQIETAAEVNLNPETGEKTAAQEERERKALLWKEMTPACRGSLVLLKQLKLKGFLFRF